MLQHLQPAFDLVVASPTVTATVMERRQQIIANPYVHPLARMGDEEPTIVNPLTDVRYEDGKLIRRAIFSNWNDALVLEIENGVLVGRTKVGRGPLQNIKPIGPLRLIEQKLLLEIVSPLKLDAQGRLMLAVADNLNAAALNVASPNIGVPVLAAEGTWFGTPLTVGSPVLGTPLLATLLTIADVQGLSTALAVREVNLQVFNSSGTWDKPAGYDPDSAVLLEGWGGGGSGGRHTTFGGGAGGGGYNFRWCKLSDLASQETITIGAGGASRSGSNQNGQTGGNTTIGSLLTAYGGGGGGQNSGANASGGGQLSAGSTGSSLNIVPPGEPVRVSFVWEDEYAALLPILYEGSGGDSNNDLPPTGAFMHGGGGGSSQYTASYRRGGHSVWGGGGGGGTPSGAGGTSSFGGNGGAGGTTGSAGTQPGGGGGGGTSVSGAGGAGRARITVFP